MVNNLEEDKLSQGRLYAFVDESGNQDLEIEKKGATKLFVCVAVIVNENVREEIEKEIDYIRQIEFKDSPIKSSKIGKRHTRRIRILKKLSNLEFGYYALIVDKERIKRDSGLKFKPSFYKYITQMLFRRLSGGIVHLKVVADRHGGQNFMNSFEKYFSAQKLPELFRDFDHEFAESSNEPLLQLADLIAGSLTFVYDSEKYCEYSETIYGEIKHKEMGINIWPFGRVPVEAISTIENEFYLDDLIRGFCIEKATVFDHQFGDSNEQDRQMQVAILRHLLSLKEFGDESEEKSIYSDSLIEHLQRQFPGPLTRQALASRVIGPLRDAGIIIAGSSEGYRLATCLNDIKIYLEHDMNIILPMIERLDVARDAIRLVSENKIDILKWPRYEGLKLLVDAFRLGGIRISELTNKSEG